MHLRTVLKSALLALVAALAPSLLAVTLAHADAPAYLPVQGYLTNAQGAPVNGTQTIRFRLYSSPLGGTPLFEETPIVFVDQGYFTTYLGETQALSLTIFRQHSAVYLGIRVGADAESAPLVELATAPYAGFAQFCADSAHATLADTATSATSATSATNANYATTAGSATSATNANYATTAGDASTLGGATAASFHTWAGLTGVPATFPPDAHTHPVASITGAQARVVGSCGAGLSIQVINADGSVTCELDNDTTYSVSTGLTLLGTTIGLNQPTIQSWCYDTEAELTAVLDDNYAPMSHTHVASDITGSFPSITSTGTVTAGAFAYSPARTLVRRIPPDHFAHGYAVPTSGGLPEGALTNYPNIGSGPPTMRINLGTLMMTSTANAVASLDDLPEGAQITSFVCYLRDNDAAGNIQLTATLQQHTYNPFSQAYTTIDLLSVTGGSTVAGYTSPGRIALASLTTTSVVDNTNSTYTIAATFTQTGVTAASQLDFYGCTVLLNVTSAGF